MSQPPIYTTPSTPLPVTENPWHLLRRLTSARIALGRAGSSLPTQAHLDFQWAHAAARDAVHYALPVAALIQQIQAAGLEAIALHSAAPDRPTYLQRPDLGRRLDGNSVQILDHYRQRHPNQHYDLAVTIADGLSALAVERHAFPLLQLICELSQQEGWGLAPITVVEQGRVAIGDEIGEKWQARMGVILLGERPGLSAPDSLGLYFTYAPQLGRTDAQRNCLSNIRQEGLSYPLAAHRLGHLMRAACQRQCSGVMLKDESVLAPGDHLCPQPNFLLETTVSAPNWVKPAD